MKNINQHLGKQQDISFQEDIEDVKQLKENFDNLWIDQNNFKKSQQRMNQIQNSKHKGDVETIYFDEEENIRILVEKCFEDKYFYETLIQFLDLESLISFSNLKRRFLQVDHKAPIKDAFFGMILKGFTMHEQFLFLDNFIHFQDMQTKYFDQYDKNVKIQSSCEKDIISDVERTFHEEESQNHVQFRRNKLTKILIALSNSVKSVGYTQGMNQILAIFLECGFGENQIYWIAKYFLNKLQLKNVMKEGMPKLNLMFYQFEIYMKNYMPDIFDHLTNEGISLSYFCPQWIITIFSYELPLQTIMKCWNLFIIKGWKMIIRFALGLLAHFKQQILSLYEDELANFVRNINEHFKIEHELDFLKTSSQFKVTNRLLKMLESMYDYQAPLDFYLSLENGKSQWLIKSSDPKINNQNVIEFMNDQAFESQQVNKFRIRNNSEVGFFQDFQNKFKQIFYKKSDKKLSIKKKVQVQEELSSQISQFQISQQVLLDITNDQSNYEPSIADVEESIKTISTIDTYYQKIKKIQNKENQLGYQMLKTFEDNQYQLKKQIFASPPIKVFKGSLFLQILQDEDIVSSNKMTETKKKKNPYGEENFKIFEFTKDQSSQYDQKQMHTPKNTQKYDYIQKEILQMIEKSKYSSSIKSNSQKNQLRIKVTPFKDQNQNQIMKQLVLIKHSQL